MECILLITAIPETPLRLCSQTFQTASKSQLAQQWQSVRHGARSTTDITIE
jgi:hypothetical protein